MKKILWVLIALLTFSLTACSSKEVYSGEGYEFGYDPNKWELVLETDDGMTSFARKGFDEATFAVSYRRYNIGVVDESGISMNERLEAFKESCDNNGQLWRGGEILEIDGREWGRSEFQDYDMNFVAYECYDRASSYAYYLLFTADNGGYDKCLKDFEEVFDSFKITD